jgi:hypothetical protein
MPYCKDVNGREHIFCNAYRILKIKGKTFFYGQDIAPADFICGWTSKTIKEGKLLFYCSKDVEGVYSSLSALQQAIKAKKGL